MITASEAKKRAVLAQESNVNEVLSILEGLIEDAASDSKYSVTLTIDDIRLLRGSKTMLTYVLLELQELGFTTEVMQDTLIIRWHPTFD